VSEHGHDGRSQHVEGVVHAEFADQVTVASSTELPAVASA
jgi:hypothetical protein